MQRTDEELTDRSYCRALAFLIQSLPSSSLPSYPPPTQSLPPPPPPLSQHPITINPNHQYTLAARQPLPKAEFVEERDRLDFRSILRQETGASQIDASTIYNISVVKRTAVGRKLNADFELNVSTSLFRAYNMPALTFSALVYKQQNSIPIPYLCRRLQRCAICSNRRQYAATPDCVLQKSIAQ